MTNDAVLTLNLTKSGNEDDETATLFSWEETVRDDGTLLVTTLGTTYHVENSEAGRARIKGVIVAEEAAKARTPEQWLDYYGELREKTRAERLTIVHDGKLYDPDSPHLSWEWDDLDLRLRVAIVTTGTYLAPGGSPMTGEESETERARLLPPKPEKPSVRPSALATKEAIEETVLAYVTKADTDGKPLSSRGIRDTVPGKSGDIDAARDSLVQQGRVVRVAGRNGGFAYRPAEAVEL